MPSSQHLLPPKVVVDRNGDGQFDWHDLEVESERLRKITVKEGVALSAETFSDGYNSLISGVAAGVLARQNKVWFTCIPDLWLLEPQQSGPARKTSLLHGFGVHIALGGHDMHGLKFGPDGKLYWSIADRATSTNFFPTLSRSFPGLTPELLANSGAVFRANPDGSQFELFAIGLRNPQELAFDDFGNLFTGDNNGDGGDKARWEYLVEGGDYGWRIGWQWLPKMGPWNAEMLWGLAPSNTATYLLPPITHVGHGPAGITYNPGTGMPESFAQHFFMADFPGGVRHFKASPAGAGFTIANENELLLDNSPTNQNGKLLWNLYPTDVDFGPAGGIYVSDWVEGWEKTGKGRIYRVYDLETVKSAIVLETQHLLANGMARKKILELGKLLSHRDQRVRQAAQFELMDRGPSSIKLLSSIATSHDSLLPRLHAIWALARFAETNDTLVPTLARLTRDPEPEIRAQAVKALGNCSVLHASQSIEPLVDDANPRVRFFATMAWGKLQLRFNQGLTRSDRAPFRNAKTVSGANAKASTDARRIQSAGLDPRPIEKLLNQTNDPWLRHAAVMALAWQGRTDLLESRFAASKNSNVRLASCLTMRRLRLPAITGFLRDPDPQIALEAARAINDEWMEECLPDLAAVIGHIRPADSPACEFFTLRRAINANLRLGDAASADRLARFAADSAAPSSLRVEALECLALWDQPPVRDRIVGLWRPLPKRGREVAEKSLEDGSEPLTFRGTNRAK